MLKNYWLKQWNSLVLTMGKIAENFNDLWDVWLFARIACLITILPMVLRFFSLPKVMQVLTPGSRLETSKPHLTIITSKIIKYTDYILNRNFWIYKNTCLKRALVLYHFLRRTGLGVQICFGVHVIEEFPQNNDVKKLQGHAWLLYEGSYFSERNTELTQKCKITYRFPEVVTR